MEKNSGVDGCSCVACRMMALVSGMAGDWQLVWLLHYFRQKAQGTSVVAVQYSG